VNRIDQKFVELRKAEKKGLITFVTAGDPDLETTINIVKEMEKNGADVIELGIPYSDPIAEGPVIQAANKRALSNAIRIKDIFDCVKRIRETVSVPLLFMLYYNCVFKYGIDKFLKECREFGIDGLIIPDLPFEEMGEIDEIADLYGIIVISMITPLSKERAVKISKKAKGFLYCVSSLGVTGIRNSFSTDFKAFLEPITASSSIPKALGFGIACKEQVASLKEFCDAIIVGSAIVKKIEESNSPEEAVNSIAKFVKELSDTIRD
jgi:tryptophan synthase alpha chain